MFTGKLYGASPVWLQNTLLSLRALVRKRMRENSKSDDLLKEISDLERDKNKLDEYVANNISEVISNAVSNVNFYRDLDLNVESNILDFPYIDKSLVKSRPEKFKSDNAPAFIVKGSTSGTTGSPLAIPQGMDSVIREQAFIDRMLKWTGYEEGDKRAWIRGDVIVPIKQKKSPFWRYSWFDNMILLSSFHMTSERIPLYIKAMCDFGVDVIQAYPSSIVTLAKYLDAKQEKYPGKLKSIMTSSESLSKEDKVLVEKVFLCKVFDWYGLFERVAAIASCEYDNYHILTDYSFVELLDHEDGTYEIVGTNFSNKYYPLIRYKTGDRLILSKKSSCPCGRVYPIASSIEGRVGDYLVGEDGQKVHILNHIPKGVSGLLGTQFIQDKSDQIEALVVIDPALYDEQAESLLISNIKERLGKSMEVVVTPVEALPRTKNGKVRQAICNLEGVS